MRTTFTLADDVAAEVEKLRRSEGIGVSDAVNRLIRRGLVTGVNRQPYRHQTAAIGIKIDITNIGSDLDLLDSD